AEHMVLPAIVIVAVNPDLEAGAAHLLHDAGVLAADVRRGEQSAIEPRAHAVELTDVGAADFLEKSRTKYTRDRATGVVGAEAEKETSRRADRAQIREQIRNAEA